MSQVLLGDLKKAGCQTLKRAFLKQTNQAAACALQNWRQSQTQELLADYDAAEADMNDTLQEQMATMELVQKQLAEEKTRCAELEAKLKASGSSAEAGDIQDDVLKQALDENAELQKQLAEFVAAKAETDKSIELDGMLKQAQAESSGAKKEEERLKQELVHLSESLVTQEVTTHKLLSDWLCTVSVSHVPSLSQFFSTANFCVSSVLLYLLRLQAERKVVEKEFAQKHNKVEASRLDLEKKLAVCKQHLDAANKENNTAKGKVTKASEELQQVQAHTDKKLVKVKACIAAAQKRLQADLTSAKVVLLFARSLLFCN